MYLNHWNLHHLPFEPIPDTRFVYYSEQHDEALMRLVYAVKSGKGACLLTGEVGSGKTTMVKVLEEQLIKENYQVGLVTNPNLGCVELLQEILYSLGVRSVSQRKIDIIHALREKLSANRVQGRDTVVIIDEAHLIREKETYEELRLLLNFQEQGRYLLTLILVGQPELKGLIAAIPQFEQRIPVRYHLSSMDFVDTCKYISFRLRAAGQQQRLFTAEAARNVYRYSFGIPRKISHICDLSLLVGFIGKKQCVDDRIVRKVIREEG